MLGFEEKTLGRVLSPTNKATERLFNLLEHLSTQAYGLSSCVAIVLGLKGSLVLWLFFSQVAFC